MIRGIAVSDSQKPAGSSGGYHFLNGSDPSASEIVPAGCAESGGSDRAYAVSGGDLLLAYQWGSCRGIGTDIENDRGDPGPRRPHIESYPNPFRSSTTLTLELPAAGFARVQVYDVRGRLVATPLDGWTPVGRHHVRFNAANLPAGSYFVRIESGSNVDTRVLTRVR